MDPALVSLLVALVVNGPAYFMLRAASRKTRSEAKSEDTRREQMEQDITERVLKLAQAEVEKMQTKVSKLEADLSKANGLIDDLLGMVRERDQAIANLQDAVTQRDSIIADLQRQLTVITQAQAKSGLNL